MIDSIGPYEIIREIGRGGMGIVYLAHDSKLNRNVAIKALPPELAENTDRLARFKREAQLLAQLNHPNIASIFGIEESGASRALIMELVEGPTLADRLAQGRLSPEESISIARQIAVALEEAHESGIVHRDLKPQNIKAPSDGTVKVLDFGLAKAMEPTPRAARSVVDISHSPTLTHSPTIATPHGTQMGVILGTAAYMSPEQARGGEIDKRADIWAFGVVLHEMLSGEAMFAADTVGDTLAGVLKSEIDFSKLPDSTAPQVRRLLRRCLERNPKNRLHDIADARIVLDEVIAGDTIEAESEATVRRKPGLLPWAIAAASVAIAVGVVLAGRLMGASAPPIGQLTRTSVLMPISGKADLTAGHYALSPDGGAVVFLASDAMGSRLFVRELDENEPRSLADTNGAIFPFWSADSQHIAFFADGMLRRVPRSGGPVQVVCAAEDGRGGAWNGEGTIVFAADFRNAPLLQVPASGGKPTPATTLDIEKGEVSHRFPSFLPNGRDFIFSVEPLSDANRAQVKVASLDEVSMGTPLLEASAAPRVAAPNHLVFPRDGALMAQPIDLARLEMAGEAQLLRERPSLLQVVTSTPIVHVADNGTMLYAPVDPRPVDFLWLDRNGARSDDLIRAEEGLFRFPTVSHSGDRVAVVKGMSFEDGELWIYDLEHGEGVQVLPRNQSAYAAVWSPDDSELAGLLNPGGLFLPAWIVPESGRSRYIFEASYRWTNPTDVSADGLVLLYDDQTPEMKQNLGYLRLDSDAERTNYLTTPAAEMGGRLSPDGEYIAYVSDATGVFEVYVDTFPTPSRARRVNTGGEALQIEFRSDGTELFILAAEGDHASLYACDFASVDELEVGRPRKLFTLPVEWTGFAPSPKGDRFLLLEPVGNRSPTLTLVGNWHAQLAQ